ncbi:MAG: MobA/MobL family protein [Hyphomicrobiaceae bacterium]
MASFRYSQSYVTRGSGKNVVANAAYNAGENLYSEALGHAAYQAGERHGRQFNFENKAAGVLHKEIMTPEHAPDWAHDREQLWNRADGAERKSNARLARKLVMNLPSELNLEQNVELVRGFLEDRFVNQGMVADFAIHAPDHDGDQRHIHCHVLLTRRTLNEHGFGKLFRDAEQGRALYQDRQAWEKNVNLALMRAGKTDRVSADSIHAQGIVREPEPVLGDKAVEEQRRRKHSRQGTLDENTKERMQRVGEVRMRNKLRAELDAKGEAHPRWLMEYYWKSRNDWIERQTTRIDKVRSRGNVHFAAKLERDLAKAKELAERNDRAWQKRAGTREGAFNDARTETTMPRRGAEPPRSQRTDARPHEQAQQAKGDGSGKGRASFRSAAAEVTGASGRVSTAGENRLQKQGGRVPADERSRREWDPNLGPRGNRKDIGDSFILSAVIDQAAAEVRSTFPYRMRSSTQGKDHHEHPCTYTTEEERRHRDAGECHGERAGPAGPSSSPSERSEDERER